MARALLEAEDITAAYGSAVVLESVTLSVHEGELLLLAGPNGAGKSTLMRVLVGLHKNFTGRVSLDGHDVTNVPPHKRARRHLGWIPEGRGIIRELSVEQNLDLAKFVPGWKPELREKSYDRFPVLKRTRNRTAGTLSGGEQQMLSLARALETNPTVLLVDEPSLGLAPKIVDSVMDLLQQLKAEGQSILLVEQRAAQVQYVADRVLLLRQGRLSEAPEALEFTEMNFLDFSQDAPYAQTSDEEGAP